MISKDVNSWMTSFARGVLSLEGNYEEVKAFSAAQSVVLMRTMGICVEDASNKEGSAT